MKQTDCFNRMTMYAGGCGEFVALIPCLGCSPEDDCEKCGLCEHQDEANAQLAAYEDTGRTPDEVVALDQMVETLRADLIKDQSDLDRANGKIQGMTEGAESLQAALAAQKKSYDELQRYNVDCTKEVGKMIVEKIALQEELAEAQRRERADWELVGEMNAYHGEELDVESLCTICIVRCRKCGWNNHGDGWWEAKNYSEFKGEQIPRFCGHCGAEFADERGPIEGGEESR